VTEEAITMTVQIDAQELLGELDEDHSGDLDMREVQSQFADEATLTDLN